MKYTEEYVTNFINNTLKHLQWDDRFLYQFDVNSQGSDESVLIRIKVTWLERKEYAFGVYRFIDIEDNIFKYVFFIQNKLVSLSEDKLSRETDSFIKECGF